MPASKIKALPPNKVQHGSPESQPPQLPGVDWPSYVEFVPVQHTEFTDSKYWTCPACGNEVTIMSRVCRVSRRLGKNGCGRHRIPMRVIGPRGGEWFSWFMKLDW